MRSTLASQITVHCKGCKMRATKYYVNGRCRNISVGLGQRFAPISSPILSLLSISIYPLPTLLPLSTMNRSGGEAFAKLAQQLNRARLQASRAAGGGGGGGAGGGGGLPSGGALAGGGLLLALAGGGLLLNSSLFNGMFFPFESIHRSSRWKWEFVADHLVDGGHRAIKYSRLHGIRPDIYPEGTHLVVCPFATIGVLEKG